MQNNVKELKCPSCGKVIKVDEVSYAMILQQVQNKEFTAQVSERVAEIKKNLEENLALQTEKDINDALKKAENAYKEEKNQMENQITTLSEQLQNAQNKLVQFDKKFAVNEQNKQLEVLKATSALKEQLNEQRSHYEEALATEKANSESEKAKLQYNLEQQKEQTEYYRDLKTKMSTKMVGETLEQHCEISFNQIRAFAFPNAEFGKDNDIRTGSKGDYIYRENDFPSGVELLSIMFEMKNEMETTKTKHKNEDFLAELDKDRREKGCEYAVLVSTLEADNEYYNAGIVDVSYKYPKMFVVRPQCFTSIIGLLRNAALGALQYKQELEIAKAQHIDISEFEDRLLDFKADFGSNVDKAGKKFHEAISGIDKAIAQMQKIREALTVTNNHLIAANNKVDKVTVKKLTKNNATVQAMIAEAKEAKKQAV